MDFIKLKDKVEQAARQAFIEIHDKYGKEDIYAFALYSDEGAMTVCPSANTLEYLAAKKETEDSMYYRFEPAEWKYEMQGADQSFDEISKMCYEKTEEIGDDEDAFECFRNQLYETCIEVLEKLKSENFFTQITGKDVFLIFTATEYEFSKSEVKKIINRLNDNDYKKEYLDWMKTW